MPRVHHRKAAKDYPKFGIAKGEMHYQWKIKLQRGGIEYRQKTPPKRSQLTASEFLGQAYDLDDSIAEATDFDGLRVVAEEVRALGEEQQEKLDNMPEGFQQGSTGELIQERIDGCKEWASEIESAADELEQALTEIDEAEAGADDDEDAGEDEDRDFEQERADALANAIEASGMQF